MKNIPDMLIIVGISIFVFGFIMDVLFGEKLEDFCKKCSVQKEKEI